LKGLLHERVITIKLLKPAIIVDNIPFVKLSFYILDAIVLSSLMLAEDKFGFEFNIHCIPRTICKNSDSFCGV